MWGRDFFDLCVDRTWDEVIVILSPSLMFRSNSFVLWSFFLPFSLLDEFQKLGIQCFYRNHCLASWANVIFLCCLPSQLPNICLEIQRRLQKGCIVYSFAAAVPIARYPVRRARNWGAEPHPLTSGFSPSPPAPCLMELVIPSKKVEAALSALHSQPF